MAVPTTYRRIAVCHLSIRSHAKDHPDAPIPELHEVIEALKARTAASNHVRLYPKHEPSQAMWISEIEECDDFFVALVEHGNKNVADAQYVSMSDPEQRRVIPKQDDEGGHFNSHVLIAKRKIESTGGHLVLIEKTSGVHRSSLWNHFQWIAGDDAIRKERLEPDGTAKPTRVVFLVDGYQSTTLQEAVRTGTFQDIEFVKTEICKADGVDEEHFIKEKIYRNKWQIKRKLSLEAAQGLLKSAFAAKKGLFGAGSDADTLLVRILSNNGSTKQAEVDEEDNFMEQAFFQSERLDFDEPLEQRHDGAQDVVTNKMKSLASSILGT